MTIIDAPHAVHVTVLADRCAGCQECVIRCPAGALHMDPDTWTAEAADDLCVGCRQCERTCPFAAITVEGPSLVAARHDPPTRRPLTLLGDVRETRLGYDSWEEALAEASRCLNCPDPTCTRGCPAHNDIPGFIAALVAHDLERAHEIISRTSVLPDVCSRVCNQAAQCEGACSWSLAGEAPVAIGRLERFVTEQMAVPAPRRAERPLDLSVAIVGSGPAGVGAAWDLVEAGASVTVFERDATPGGLCGWGMPDFTLPDEVATRAWRQLVEAGVDLRCSSPVSAHDVESLLAGYDAVVMAHGAGTPIRLPVPGAELAGVVDATHFLQGAKAALMPAGDVAQWRRELGLSASRLGAQAPRVLVLGAGNTAMDVARTALRLGLRAVCVDWLDERFALARPDELVEARHEGVEVRFSRTLTCLHGADGRVTSATLAHTVQKERSRPPTVVAAQTDELDIDLVVMAMGYRVDAAFADALPGLPVRKRSLERPDGRWVASGILARPASEYAHGNAVGELAWDREVGLWAAASSVRPRVWAAGDALTGPATVVEAMAQGRRAAAAVLAARPAKPGEEGAERRSAPPRVLVAYESIGGRTASVAQLIGDQLSESGALVSVLPISRVGAREVASCDALVVGTWVEGLVVARVRPARATREWISHLGPLGGRPVAAFCTFGVDPRGALDALSSSLAARGGSLVAAASFGPRQQRPGVPFGPRSFARDVASALREARTGPAFASTTP